MKYCYHCGRITAGEPLFCNCCGRSYDVKLCPRLHPNPRSAEGCSQCGSRELSTPQPRVSVWWRILEWLTRMFLGAFLGLLSIVVLFEILKQLLQSPPVQSGLIVLGLLLSALWLLWGLLPDWFRKLVRKSLRRRSGGGHER